MTVAASGTRPPGPAAPVGTDLAPSAPRSGPDEVSVPAGTIVTLAAASAAAAGAVHFALLPHHAEGWMAEGIAFGITGALQIGLALLVLIAPSRPALLALAAVCAGAATLWAVSITVGLPVGPNAGVAEAPDLVGWVTFGLEAVAVLAAVLGALQPASLSRPRTRGAAVRSAVVAGVALAGVGIVLSLPVAEHSHAAGAAGDGHEHAHAQGTGAVDSASARMSVAERDALGQQLSVVREIALTYPTVADAEAAGFNRAGPYAPGAGAHYVNTANTSSEFVLEKPLSLLYGGTSPSSPVVGVMYYLLTDAPPEGFAGPTDEWHKHSGACLVWQPDGKVDTPLPVDADTTRAQCDEVGGEFMDVTGWMTHAWVVPGWDSPVGVFAHDHPDLICRDGTSDLGSDLNRGCQGL